jgi:hypothetical protein
METLTSVLLISASFALSVLLIFLGVKVFRQEWRNK